VAYNGVPDNTGLQFYNDSFSTVVASKVCEIPRNSPKIRTYSSSMSSKVTDLGAN